MAFSEGESPSGAVEFHSPQNTSIAENTETVLPVLESLPSDWGDKVASWRPGQEAPPLTVVRNGVLFAKGVEPPPAIAIGPKPKAVEDDEPDNEAIATVPEILPLGGLSLYIDFAKGGDNPNLVDASLEEQVTERSRARRPEGFLSGVAEQLVQRLPWRKRLRQAYPATGD